MDTWNAALQRIVMATSKVRLVSMARVGECDGVKQRGCCGELSGVPGVGLASGDYGLSLRTKRSRRQER